MPSQSVSEYAISVTGLKKSFKKLEVLKGVDLKVKRGTVLALLGPNGAGKTTTVRILATLLKPDAGTVLVNGHDVVTHADDVRHSIGLTGQYAAVDTLLSGRENLVMMGRLYHLSAIDARRRAEELLKRFDLVDAADRPAKTYSGGMSRRLDLALSLVATPPVIFLDEPTTGLDPRSRLAVWEIVEELRAADVTVLLTTQYLEEADKLADRIAVIDRGIVIAEGTSDELKNQVGKERLEITLATDEDFRKVVGLLGAEVVHSDKDDRLVSLATDGSVSNIKKLLDRMEQENVDIDTLNLHKPTLDDVFLHLTGHEAEAEEKTNTATV